MVNQNSNEYNEYHKVELPALNQLQKIGWTYIYEKFLSHRRRKKNVERCCFRKPII